MGIAHPTKALVQHTKLCHSEQREESLTKVQTQITLPTSLSEILHFTSLHSE